MKLQLENLERASFAERFFFCLVVFLAVRGRPQLEVSLFSGGGNSLQWLALTMIMIIVE
jgi:hypothetical protein